MPSHQQINMDSNVNLNLSLTEQDAVTELQNRIPRDLNQRIFDDPYVYYRFLKARYFDVKQAEKMLQNSLKWRKENGVDSIVKDYNPPEVLNNIWGKSKICFDKDGCPVYFLPGGKIDIIGLLKSVTDSEMDKYFTYEFESYDLLLKEQSKKINKLVSFVFIYDMSGFSFAVASDKRGILMVSRVLKVLQDNYPDRLKTVYVVNVSRIFTFHFSIIKQVLNANVLKKIQLYSTDEWKNHLAECIDVNELPAVLGGKKTDPDGNPLCLTLLVQAGKIDEKYYKCNVKNSIIQKSDAKILVLPRASFQEIKIEIKEPGSIIEWEFEIKARDIGFGMFFIQQHAVNESLEEIVPLGRLSTDNFSEIGMVKCEKCGIYIMLFDNSYSWIRSKEIYYITNIISPIDHKKQIDGI